MFTDDDDATTKASLFDSIVRSSVPKGWINETDAVFVFNEVTITTRFHYMGDATPEVEILDFEDLS